MEKMKRRSAWIRIMAVVLALVTGITMMPLDTFAAAGKDSGAYLTGSEAADDELMLNAACDHVHDDCDCDDCAHDDCDCEDHCGESHSCDYDVCSEHADDDDVTADGAAIEGTCILSAEYNFETSRVACTMSSIYLMENPNFSSITYSFLTDYDNGMGYGPKNIEGRTYWLLGGNWANLTRTGDYTASFIAMQDGGGSRLLQNVAPQMLEGKVYIQIYGDNMGSPFQIGYNVSTSPDLASDSMRITRDSSEELTREEIDKVKVFYFDSNYLRIVLEEGFNYTKTVTTETDSNKQEWWVVKYTAITGRAQNEKTVKFKKAGGESETHTVTVNYAVPSGYTKPESQTKTGAKGETYSFTSPTITGLTPDKAVVSGTFGDEDETFTVTYTKTEPGTGKDLSSAKVVGLNEDKDHEYTEEEVKRIGLEDENGKPLVKGKEFTEVISEKTDDDGKLKWVIEYEPIEGKSKGHKGVEVKKPDPSKPKHNVTVYYTLPSPGNGVRGQSVAPTVVKSYYEGETYSIAAPKVAVPGKDGKYYRQSNYYVTGMMGTTDQEHTVIYEYSEQAAEVPFKVEVFYKIQAREGENPEKPEDVKISPLQNGDQYYITSPQVQGYLPDIKEVMGRIQGDDVVETVTYRPIYYVSCTWKFPDGQTVKDVLDVPDGGAYYFPVAYKDVVNYLDRYNPGLLGWVFQVMNKTWEAENAVSAAWTPKPGENITGVVQGKNEAFTVEYTCSHPGRYYEQIEFSRPEKQNGTHVGLCSLCNAELEPEEACVFERVGFVRPDEMNSPYDKKFPAGAILYKCTKCDNFYYVDSKNDICPASSKDDPQPHLWSHWNKVSDTQCERTCARCKETITTGHVWGEWEYTTSKVHSRRCSLCHCTQTGDHGAWSNATVHKNATCIADAEVGATCGICNKQINNVYYGIVGSIDPKYARTGHDFSGGYARIHGGHVQKCKICGAFDMEHHESHAWSDWYATEGGDSCTGTRKMRRECVCGAYETKTEENSHNYVRDPSRETTVTCESAGKECYTCTKCGDQIENVVEALGHAWVEDEGNYPAKCGQEGRMWWHCANPGCSATKKDDCPAPSDHEWVPNWISKASCTREGVKNGEICSHCGEHRNEGDLEYVDRLNHDLETTKTLKRSGTYVSKTGNAAFDQEVWVVTNRCKTCGYNFPEAVYTVAKSGNLSRYKIEPGDVKITDMGDGIHVSGQFGKANAVYFNNTVNGAFKEVVDNLLNIYRQKEGSVITEFTPEFMNSLKDGEYEMIHVNGDELSAATLTVKDHKFVTPEGAQDGKLPGIKSLDESGVIGATVDPDLSEKIEVGGQEVDYYPWMADGEMLYYLGQIEDNPTSVDAPDMGEGYTAQTAHADPCVTPETADFDRKEGSRDNADVVVVKSDKGHTFDSAHPISLFGENVPETEEVESEDGEEKVTRTNYVIAGDKITFKKDYLESLGEGEHTFLINYTGGAQPGQVTVNIKGIPASGSEEDDEPETGFWNLFDNANEHKYTVSGVSTATEAANNNKNSSKYFNATLKDNEITVSLKDGADRKKAAASNAFDFDLGDAGTVSYTLPLTYNKPVLKLSSAKGTVKKGKSTVLSTRVYAETENGNYVPFDLEGATVTYGTNTVTTGKNGIVKITADGKTSGKIRIMRWGWNEKDPVELGYSIAEVKPEKDVVTVDLGGVKQVVLNSNAPEQAFEFPVYLNGEPATADTVVLTANKAEAAALGSIGEGVLNVSIGRSGLTKGSYTLTVASKNDTKAKVNVKVKISDKALSAAATGKIKQKLDVVTNVPMLVEPTLKEVSGKIMDVSVSVTDEAAVYKDFRATLSGGNISVRYVGKTPLDAKKLKFGNMKFSLTVDGITDPVEFIIKNVSAKKTTPAVKASKVVIPKSAAEKATGETVIATANILSTYKDTAKHVRTIKPEKVNLVCKNVTATVDPGNNTRVLIKKLDGSSGSVKATLTYAGGVTKTVTIKVSKGKK